MMVYSGAGLLTVNWNVPSSLSASVAVTPLTSMLNVWPDTPFSKAGAAPNSVSSVMAYLLS